MHKNKETPRGFYADDQVWAAVYAVACNELKDAMDLAYLTGQRTTDVLEMRILLDDPDHGRTQLGQLLDRMRNRERKVASLFIVSTPGGGPLNKWTLRTRFDDARADAVKAATEANKADLADRIKVFQFHDIRPKAASETDLAHASKLLGHTDKQITRTVYQRVGETVSPTR